MRRRRLRGRALGGARVPCVDDAGRGAEAAFARLVTGLYAHACEQVGLAEERLFAAADPGGPLEDWRLYVLADSAAARGHRAASPAPRLAKLLGDYPASPLRPPRAASRPPRSPGSEGTAPGPGAVAQARSERGGRPRGRQAREPRLGDRRPRRRLARCAGTRRAACSSTRPPRPPSSRPPRSSAPPAAASTGPASSTPAELKQRARALLGLEPAAERPLDARLRCRSASATSTGACSRPRCSPATTGASRPCRCSRRSTAAAPPPPSGRGSSGRARERGGRRGDRPARPRRTSPRPSAPSFRQHLARPPAQGGRGRRRPRAGGARPAHALLGLGRAGGVRALRSASCASCAGLDPDRHHRRRQPLGARLARVRPAQLLRRDRLLDRALRPLSRGQQRPARPLLGGAGLRGARREPSARSRSTARWPAADTTDFYRKNALVRLRSPRAAATAAARRGGDRGRSRALAGRPGARARPPAVRPRARRAGARRDRAGARQGARRGR